MLITKSSVQEVANHFGMNNISLIVAWKQKFLNGGVDALSKKKGVPSMNKNNKQEKKLTREQELEYENQLLSGACFFKKLRASGMNVPERLKQIRSKNKFITRRHSNYPFSLKLLNFLNYIHVLGNRFDIENPDKNIEEKIKSIFEIHCGRYGYRRITATLRDEGIFINQKKVRRIMKKLELKCTSFSHKSRKYNSYRGTIGKIANNKINRRFTTSVPHQKITTDTTEFKIYNTDDNGRISIKKAYLDPFLDMFNGEILSYSISEKPNFKSISEALNKAINITNDCNFRRTFHSDQGWAYQMNKYSKILKSNKIFQSMSRKGTCLDNSPMKIFWNNETRNVLW